MSDTADALALEYKIYERPDDGGDGLTLLQTGFTLAVPCFRDFIRIGRKSYRVYHVEWDLLAKKVELEVEEEEP